MTKSVYLAGPIKGLSYTSATGWREDAAEFLEEHGVEVRSPMRNKENLRNEKNLTGPFVTPLSTCQAITMRDRYDVMSSDIILAYMVGSNTLSIGTAIEIGWADAYRKPLVLVDNADSLYDHPMVRTIAGFVVNTLEEGLEITLSLLNIPRVEAIELPANKKPSDRNPRGHRTA